MQIIPAFPDELIQNRMRLNSLNNFTSSEVHGATGPENE